MRRMLDAETARRIAEAVPGRRGPTFVYRKPSSEELSMTAREYTDLRKEFYSSTLRLDLTEGVKHRLKFHRDAASYESTRVKAASILLDVVGSPDVVKAVAEACLAELERRGRAEADGLDEKATQLRDAIEE